MITAVTLGSTNFGSTSDVAIDLLFAVACAVWGYHISRRHRLVRGVTPWRLPSLVWAVICLLLQPFGIIMELVAEFTTRPALPGSPGSAGSPAQMSANFAAYPAPSVAPTVGTNSPEEITPAADVIRPPEDGSGKPALFGWYPDPMSRHELRYWDGKHWSTEVADHGSVSSDPVG